MSDAAIQILQCPETLNQLYDRIDETHVHYKGVGYKYSDIAFEAAIKGHNVSMELWAAGIWAVTWSCSEGIAFRALSLLEVEVRAKLWNTTLWNTTSWGITSVWFWRNPSWGLLSLAYMICPKDSKFFPLILYSLAGWITRAKPGRLQTSPTGDIITVTYDDLLSAVVSNPTATARLRARALFAQVEQRKTIAASELIRRAYVIDPTYIGVYTYWLEVDWFATGNEINPSGVIQLGGQVLNKWGLVLKAIETVIGAKTTIYLWLLDDEFPELDGTTISLGDSSMSVFDYLCALETPDGSFFRFKMLTGMVPADTPWSCRRHEALDRRTGANALFATFLCALARLEGPGGPLRPSHQTVWEDALESWTLGDSARMWVPPDAYDGPITTYNSP